MANKNSCNETSLNFYYWKKPFQFDNTNLWVETMELGPFLSVNLNSKYGFYQFIQSELFFFHLYLIYRSKFFWGHLVNVLSWVSWHLCPLYYFQSITTLEEFFLAVIWTGEMTWVMSKIKPNLIWSSFQN